MDAANGAAITSEAPTLRQQFFMVAGFAVFLMVCLGLDGWDYAAEADQNKTTPYTIIAGIVNGIGCALWVNMDRRRRGQDPGILKYVAILLGPVAVCLQLILDYKGRALFLLPIVVVIYLAIGVVPYAALLAIQKFWT